MGKKVIRPLSDKRTVKENVALVMNRSHLR